MSRSILVVEDDRDIADLVRLHLGDAGYRVEAVGSGESARGVLRRGRFDLLILDLMLPGRIDGLALCREVRTATPYLPVLMLTSKASEIDRVVGLEMGADDYITKPFSIRELVARVKALFRRIDAMSDAAVPAPVHMRIGDLSIDSGARQVEVAGRPVELTAREFDLLLFFANHPGQVFTRAQLLDQVWGYGHEGYEHTVNSHINRLRAKIETDPSKPRYVRTVWGVGYRFAATSDTPSP